MKNFLITLILISVFACHKKKESVSLKGKAVKASEWKDTVMYDTTATVIYVSSCASCEVKKIGALKIMQTLYYLGGFKKREFLFKYIDLDKKDFKPSFIILKEI